jgi:hypothetical protein
LARGSWTDQFAHLLKYFRGLLHCWRGHDAFAGREEVKVGVVFDFRPMASVDVFFLWFLSLEAFVDNLLTLGGRDLAFRLGEEIGLQFRKRFLIVVILNHDWIHVQLLWAATKLRKGSDFYFDSLLWRQLFAEEESSIDIFGRKIFLSFFSLFWDINQRNSLIL